MKLTKDEIIDNLVEQLEAVTSAIDEMPDSLLTFLQEEMLDQTIDLESIDQAIRDAEQRERGKHESGS